MPTWRARVAASGSSPCTAPLPGGGCAPSRVDAFRDRCGARCVRSSRSRPCTINCCFINAAKEVTMHLERNDAMSRLLERHPTVEHVPGSSGQGTLIRRDQLLVSKRDAAAVEERIGRWLDNRETDEEAGVAVLHLRPGVDVCELAASLSAP